MQPRKRWSLPIFQVTNNLKNTQIMKRQVDGLENAHTERQSWRCPSCLAQRDARVHAIPCAGRQSRRNTFRESQYAVPFVGRRFRSGSRFRFHADLRNVHFGVERTFCLPLQKFLFLDFLCLGCKNFKQTSLTLHGAL
jgi:hypothetical protein